MAGAVVFSVDLSWVVGSVSTVVFMSVVVNVDSAAYAVVDDIVIAVDGIVDAAEALTAVIAAVVGGDVVRAFGTILP